MTGRARSASRQVASCPPDEPEFQACPGPVDRLSRIDPRPPEVIRSRRGNILSIDLEISPWVPASPSKLWSVRRRSSREPVGCGASCALPPACTAVIVFAHGSGSGRFSPRNQYVARVLQQSHLATLLVDLLEDDEAEDRSLVFDIGLLADRLESATVWLAGPARDAEFAMWVISAPAPGAGAALLAASRESSRVGAIVSRGGRPDLAREALHRVTAPTLLIVGGDDEDRARAEP